MTNLSVGYLVLSAMLFAMGAYGLLRRRNPLVMLMCVELMLNAVNLSFVGFARTFPAGSGLTGHLSPLFTIAIAAAEACVGLAMVICIVRGKDSIDADAYAEMKE